RATGGRAQRQARALAGGLARGRGREVLERRAHRDEPPPAARPALVEHARDELAAGAVLAADEDRGAAVGELLDGDDHAAHRDAVGHEEVIRLQARAQHRWLYAASCSAPAP